MLPISTVLYQSHLPLKISGQKNNSERLDINFRNDGSFVIQNHPASLEWPVRDVIGRAQVTSAVPFNQIGFEPRRILSYSDSLGA
jgi:hypothetical protein